MPAVRRFGQTYTLFWRERERDRERGREREREEERERARRVSIIKNGRQLFEKKVERRVKSEDNYKAIK
jgi:hypothetical protein